MQKQLMFKCLALVLLGLGLLVPLSMIESTIMERSSFRREAVNRIAANSAGPQTLMGPILVLPVEEEFDEPTSEEETADGHGRRPRVTHKRDIILFPKRLSLDGGLEVSKRAYGIHEVSVYEMLGVLSGEFDAPAEGDLPATRANAVVRWGKPRLVVGLTDSRGIVSEPKILLGDQTLKVVRGTALPIFGSGFQAPVDSVIPGMTKPLTFRVDLKLSGTESFGMIPLADQTTANLSSNWSHPSFGGGFLPRNREIGEQGFKAHWMVSALAANVQENVVSRSSRRVPGQPEAGSIEDLSSFRVSLIDPVDVYHQSVRAVKYGILFVVLTFAAFFLFESLRSLPIHPIQYGLVGLALAIFFLLLVSLTEHFSFAIAYGVSGLSCVGLIAVYLASVLKGWRRGVGFAFMLSMLYGYLYGVLASEQNALLLGAALLFIVLSALMIGTRKVNWYALKVALPE